MKRNTLFLSFSLVLLAVSLALTSLLRLTATNTHLAVEANVSSAIPVIVLDAGHGGEDGGAAGVDGTMEKDLNLAVARMLADLLRTAGYTVVETRTEDRMLYDESAQKGHKKQSDLKNRLAISNQYPGSLFVSIHMNSYPGVACEGLQVWYSPNDPTSALWAEAVQSGVKDLLQPDNNRKIKMATSAIYVLRKAKNPAILIECGFLSNPAECQMLSNETYQRKLALSIFTSLTKKMQNDSCTAE